MDLQHEDLLIRLRGKLNEEKIKLWEPPYAQPNGEVSPSLQDLAKKYSSELSLNYEVVFNALHELQLHSLDRSKANTEFKETGLATFRVKATVPGNKPNMLRVQKRLDIQGSELISTVANELGVTDDRLKLIFNGKVIKPTPSLDEQGVKNGAQIMALVMAAAPEIVKKEDNMYMEMKATRDDAQLLSEYIDDFADDDEYMKLEDQSGNTVELPPAERKSLLVGLALHERGRAAARQRDYSLALVLFLEADRQFNECRSSILKTVDNWAVLQLDIAWCYLCLQSLSAASDAAHRLQRAEDSFTASYGQDHQRLIALKGTAANERVLIMRLYLLQGIVAYHQNKRAEALRLFEKAEVELNALRVDENSVSALTELGWSRGQARAGLRAAGGQLDRAHHYLHSKRQERDQARDQHKMDRQKRLLGVCEDGSPVNPKLVEALVGMGYSRRLCIVALRNANNHAADAVRLIQEQPELLADSEMSSDDTATPSSDESLVEPDNRLVAELEAMGYAAVEARAALRMRGNRVHDAVDLLVAGGGRVTDDGAGNPSTSKGTSDKKRSRKHKKDKSKRRERELALARLSAAIRGEEDEHLHSSLQDEEHFLAQYKSLL
uniref:NEDD8 ultimate buster 1 n=1 Tax=Pectinophora gossypiella TaxID=13191 RepID=A0A1E1W3D2_PECGO